MGNCSSKDHQESTASRTKKRSNRKKRNSTPTLEDSEEADFQGIVVEEEEEERRGVGRTQQLQQQLKEQLEEHPPATPPPQQHRTISSNNEDGEQAQPQPPPPATALTGILLSPPVPRGTSSSSGRHQHPPYPQQENYSSPSTTFIPPALRTTNSGLTTAANSPRDVHARQQGRPPSLHSFTSSVNSNSSRHHTPTDVPCVLQFPTDGQLIELSAATNSNSNNNHHQYPPTGGDNPLLRPPAEGTMGDDPRTASIEASAADEDDETERRKSSVVSSNFRLFALTSGTLPVPSNRPSGSDPFAGLFGSTSSSRGALTAVGMASGSTAPPSPFIGSATVHPYSRIKSRSSNSAFYRHYIGKLTSTDPASQHRKLPLTPTERRQRQRAEIQAFEVHEVPSTIGLGVPWPCPHLCEVVNPTANNPTTSATVGGGGFSTVSATNFVEETTLLSPRSQRSPVPQQTNNNNTYDNSNNSSYNGTTTTTIATQNLPQDCVTLSGLEDQIIATTTTPGRGQLQLQRSNIERRRTLERCLVLVSQLMRNVSPVSDEGNVYVHQIQDLAKAAGLEKIYSITIFIISVVQDLYFLDLEPETCVTMIHRSCANHFEVEFLEDANYFFPSSSSPSAGQGGVLDLTDEHMLQEYIKYLTVRFRTDVDYAIIVLVLLICQGLGRVPWAMPPSSN